MKTAFQRGFIEGYRRGVSETMPEQADDLTRSRATIAILTRDGTDYPLCTEEELRFERGLVVEALEWAVYHGVMRKTDDEEADERRAFGRIPEHLQEGVKYYLDEHRKPGHFLTAVFEGDLFEAMGRADINSRTGLWDLVVYLYNHAPSPAFGSKTKVKLWLEAPIPTLNVAHVGVDLETTDGGQTACPGCGGAHLVHHASVEAGKVTLPADREARITAPHMVQFVWCRRIRLHVVGVEGKEFTV